jgi:hypothetical protein
MTLTDLRETAPRTFDKQLIDALVAALTGATPVRVETTDVGARVAALEQALVIAAEGLASTQTQMIDLAQRLATIEGAMRALAVEAERNLRVA